MPTGNFDINELKRRMQGATQALKHELGGLRTGRASASMLEPVQVDAYGTHMPLNQLATISVPEPRLLSVQVWDKSMVKAVEKAIVDSNLGLSPATEGQVLRLRIPELNEDRRKELVKVAHKYAETARIAVRHVRRDGLDTVKNETWVQLIQRIKGAVSPHTIEIACYVLACTAAEFASLASAMSRSNNSSACASRRGSDRCSSRTDVMPSRAGIVKSGSSAA